MTNKRYFATDIETGIEGIKNKFRAKYNIKSDAHVIFIAPGNEKNEAEFCLENLRKGIKEFLLKYSSPSSLSPKALPLDGNFVTILSLHKGSEGEEYAKKYIKDHEWTGKLIVVTNEDN